jgi:hypothetical protein
VELPSDRAPPPEVTAELFFEWRAPRRGTDNPAVQTNPVWTWLARNPEVNAWQANRHFGGPSALGAGPGWCACRFGQSETELPDGRVVLIGGEHEDHYDPDFYIYNDVFVRDRTGAIEILGYAPEVFPPTDFHSATLVGDRIVVIGSLGYPNERDPARTPVLSLDITTLAFAPVETTGDAPGWIHRHVATLAPDGHAIVVKGGERIIVVDGSQELRDNHDEWSLDLERRVWTRLTDRRFPVYELARADGSSHELMWIGFGAFHVGRDGAWDREQLAQLEQRFGFLPDFELFAVRFAPPCAHTPLPDDDLDRLIAVDGITVRYADTMSAVRITVEGQLAPERIDELVEDARAKLERIERTPWTARRLEP